MNSVYENYKWCECDSTIIWNVLFYNQYWKKNALDVEVPDLITNKTNLENELSSGLGVLNHRVKSLTVQGIP